MQERPENFNTAGGDPEATLVTPRFDETEARRAHPVVPLNEVPPLNASHLTRPRRPRRSWTPALLAVALLAVAALGGAVATKVMQGPRAEQTQEPAQEQTQAAPVQTAEAPPPQPSTPAVAEAPREDTPAANPAPRKASTRRTRAATATLVVAEREEAEDYEDEERREAREEKRREREDEMEKEMRKAMKRAKGKAPRLVDVITNP